MNPALPHGRLAHDTGFYLDRVTVTVQTQSMWTIAGGVILGGIGLFILWIIFEVITTFLRLIAPIEVARKVEDRSPRDSFHGQDTRTDYATHKGS